MLASAIEGIDKKPQAELSDEEGDGEIPQNDQNEDVESEYLNGNATRRTVPLDVDLLKSKIKQSVGDELAKVIK